MYKVLPIISQEGSDSAMLDNALEFMVMSGMELPMAVMILIPAPWQHDRFMPQEVKDFYRYYATMMEPWDGPASIVFSEDVYKRQPLCISPAVKTFSTLVAYFPASVATLVRAFSSTPNASAT